VTTIVDTNESCGANTACLAVDTCVGQQGAACGGPGQATSCASGFCTDGVCCEAACNGTCQKCDSTGHCNAVVSDYDDSCTSGKACGASSTCLDAPGASCSTTPDCAWGSCVASFEDFDQDGWGDSARSTGLRCIQSDHKGNGYSDRGGDCCDSHWLAHPPDYPGQQQWNYPPDVGCVPLNGNDWNCDGVVETDPPVCPTLQCPAWGAGTYSCFQATPQCGFSEPTNLYDCDASCNCTFTGTSSNTTECE
jgi:hypothetical protein